MIICCIAAPGKNEEDELYESYINETNKVYKINGEELVEASEYSGTILKHEMLRSKEVSVLVLI